MTKAPKRNAFLPILTLLMLMGGQRLHASHTWGFELTYECINTCDIRVYQRGIRDCLGAQYAINFAQVGIYPSPSTCPMIQPIDTVSALEIWDVTPICPGQQSRCDTVTGIFGVEYHQFYQDFSYCNLPSNCSYTFSYASCCRTYASSAIDNLGWAVNLVLDAGQAVCNNSPVYNNEWRIWIDQNGPTVLDLGGIDPDGDSLSYELATCMHSYNQPTIYKPGFSYMEPLGPHIEFDLDPRTGNLFINPITPAVAANFICIRVTEWRNGVIVGETTRDLLLNPIFNPNPTPQFQPYTNISGGVEVYRDVFNTCVGNTLSFDIPVTDSGSTLSMKWDQRIAGASFSDANNSNVTDSIFGVNAVTGRFQFTPTVQGTYYFQVDARDGTCLIEGRTEKTIEVRAINSDILIADTLSCNEVQFSALICGGSSYTYQWSGTGGLTGSGNNLTHTYDQPGTYSYQVTATDSNLNQTVLTGTVTVTQDLLSPVIDAPDTLIGCQGVGLVVNAMPGYTNHQWSNGFTGTTATALTQGWLYLQANSSVGCTRTDSVYIDFQTPGYASIIQTSGTPTLDVCNGITQVSIAAAGNYSSYGWSNGDTGPQATVSQPGTYHVTATEPNGCSFMDSIVVAAIPQDISGNIQTLNSTPLAGQTVYLIKLNSITQLLERVDSSITDQDGNYYFCGLNTTAAYYVQANPDVNAYPNELPAYAGGTMVWNQTYPLYPATLGPQQVDFSVLRRYLIPGTGTLSGQVLGSQSGMPEPGLRLFLVLNNQEIIGYQDTDANGEFSFGNLPLGNYSIVPDRPYVDHVNVPQVVVSSTNPSLDSLDLVLHPTFLELVTPTALQSEKPNLSFEVVPNPIHQHASIQLEMPNRDEIKIELFDVQGRNVKSLYHGVVAQGSYHQNWIPDQTPGVYFIRLSGKDFSEVRKIILLAH